MYRIAVCEDDPRTAEQNKTAVCHVLDGKGRAQGRDYDIDIFHAAAPLIERLSAALDWDWQRRQEQKKRPVLRVGGRTIPLGEITYLETSGRKTAIHTGHERIEYAVPLSKLKEEFQSQGFCLSHFSYLGNLSHVTRVERDTLTLDTGESIPVSRRYYPDFMAHYVESLK